MFPYLIKIEVRKLLMDKKIDFVLTWVDGNDPEWQSVYNQYAEVGASDKNIIRFRDWNNLKYWFRGVEKFAPWVNIVHFVTCGHYPEWLNLQCNKLNLVKHTDYIPNKWLPTFNSNVIELNLHRINGLAENFVLFNDDMFLINDVSDDFFFKNGMPCDMGVLNVIDHFKIGHIILNDLVLINKYFKKNSVLKKNYSKWFNIKYGKYLVRTMSLMPWKYFTGFTNPHVPSPFLKSTFCYLWNLEPELFSETSSHKFRESADVSQYLFRYWQLCKGSFSPLNVSKFSYNCAVDDDNIPQITQIIQKQMKKMICLNDSDDIDNFDRCKADIIKSFDLLLPEKSQFEL